MHAPRILSSLVLLVLVLPGVTWAQGVPSGSSEPHAVEVDIQAREGGASVSAEDARRLGIATDGSAARLVPPSLQADSPAAWPEGLEATAAEVTLELLIDEHGQVADTKVVQAPPEPRLTEAALKAAPGLRFQPAKLGGVPVSVRLPFTYPFRVVMLMPGVGSLASGLSYPVVRGGQPAATGFFLDGVRIPMLYHLLLGPAIPRTPSSPTARCSTPMARPGPAWR